MVDPKKPPAMEIRAGEVSNGGIVTPDAAVQFIGVIRTPFVTRELCPRQGRPDGPECRLEFDPQWEAALDGILKYAHLDVLYWLHQSRRDLVLQSPKGNGKTIGTFALRSPVRPNPIGLSRVQLMRQDGPVLVVRGLDCLDGTPLVDVKPSRCEFSPKAPAKVADTI